MIGELTELQWADILGRGPHSGGYGCALSATAAKLYTSGASRRV